VFGSYVNILYEPLERERNVTPAETNRFLNVQGESRCSLWEGPKVGNTEKVRKSETHGVDKLLIYWCWSRWCTVM